LFPLSDDNPRRHLTPYVTWSLIAANAVVFLWQLSLGPTEGELAVYALGMIPARLFGYGDLPPELAGVPPTLTILTSMFMHGGWLHIGSNMLYLWIFGDNIEDSMGHGRYAVFYLLGGAAAALTQGALYPASEIPMIGASGAVSAVLGAYILLHPGATVRVLIFLGFFVTLAHVPALIVLGIWFLGQLLAAPTMAADEPGVAFAAHIGGFVAGLVLVPFFKRRRVPLLEKPRHRPFELERRRGPWG
jgi:membrane associated rhomboid family serine protease